MVHDTYREVKSSSDETHAEWNFSFGLALDL